ncbi:hypothetical protein WA026_017088 [Henosepilachna vigintioctopunctata]|uniref:Gustatory receptor n=1 Tax=Henosepilachna vigintioctopunctata TaxID=420089 RepID=A0AAW1TW19_9CUCU
MNDIFYYLGGALTSVSFIILASNWKSLMKKFDVVEKFLLNYPRSKKLPTKMKILTLSLIFFAAAEHFTINCINLMKSFECEKNLSDIFERFFARITYIQIFRYIPYNFFIGLYLQIQNLYVAFAWTFIDIFLMNASIHFTDKLIQLKNQISLTIQERHTNNKIEEVCLELVAAEKTESYHHLTDSDEIRAYIGALYYQGLWKSADVDDNRLWDKKMALRSTDAFSQGRDAHFYHLVCVLTMCPICDDHRLKFCKTFLAFKNDILIG